MSTDMSAAMEMFEGIYNDAEADFNAADAEFNAAVAKRNAADAKRKAAQAALATYTLPSATLKEPSATLEKPSATLKEPSATLEKPSATLEKPSATLEKPSATLKEPSATLKEPSPSPVPFRSTPPHGAVKPMPKKDGEHDKESFKGPTFIGSTVIFNSRFEAECGYVPTSPIVAKSMAEMVLSGAFSAGDDQGSVTVEYVRQRADGWVVKFSIPEYQLKLAKRFYNENAEKWQWVLGSGLKFDKWLDNHHVATSSDYSPPTPPQRPLVSDFI